MKILRRVFIDGACKGNHLPKAQAHLRTAGIGLYYTKPVRAPQICGSCPPPFLFVDVKIAEPYPDSAEFAPVTNQRVELWAMIRCLEHFETDLKRDNTEIEVLTDSKYVFGLYNRWYLNADPASRPEKKTNADMVARFVDTLDEIFGRSNRGVKDARERLTVLHTPAHGKEPADKTGGTWLRWYGNDQADLLANQGARAFSKGPRGDRETSAAVTDPASAADAAGPDLVVPVPQ